MYTSSVACSRSQYKSGMVTKRHHDEMSMMSADQLEAIDMRLRHITQNVLENFGGLDVIL
ncbi:hypothetical protein HPB48_007896 [Haemaphysalis longicornis]|uniref:Uncharacterized protein n=1 Tax=Haemaphysalis longicornis TaxID=44386 RepID=A0A9J6G7Y6_HAELO|nr:hypothetical protein HPB48_007896 [Haemaphysalis longicornis]